ncbi:MAG: hypothetical protein BGN98_09105 [Microbacterium sp. 69-7]|uniref:hypothetical protein n=1 Tax=Microbacterium sp. 69-7 TaxID=1895784 RepID=UPI00025861AE|nr:hypothetical protein [Microbacterium sp. 69-7]EIC07506.1 hypothetical protein OR221_2189 [Microbacterium laevaniformans OR221]OJU46975.1 MAG: hypothetical protein BGN98_09105 [Microbacterium sp. 69-7]
MIDAFLLLLRTIGVAVGILPAGVSPITSLAVVAAGIALAAAVLVVMAAGAATRPDRSAHDRIRPARSDVLSAPVAQSDPDAPGHILRRGPSAALPAA